MPEPNPSPTPSGPTAATSLSLLERLRDQDSEAWRRFVHIYGPLVYAWCRRLGVDGEDAADVIQEVWAGVTTNLRRFERTEQSGTFRGWLWTITRHKLCDHFRTRQNRPAAAGGSTAHQLIQTIQEEELPDESGVETHGVLRRALELIQPEFEDRTWKAFWRTTVDGLRAADAGAELGLAANAVHQAKFRVMRRLRQEMAGMME